MCLRLEITLKAYRANVNWGSKMQRFILFTCVDTAFVHSNICPHFHKRPRARPQPCEGSETGRKRWPRQRRIVTAANSCVIIIANQRGTKLLKSSTTSKMKSICCACIAHFLHDCEQREKNPNDFCTALEKSATRQKQRPSALRTCRACRPCAQADASFEHRRAV
jgi:hypothetical protein